jgi:hypothetical protein
MSVNKSFNGVTYSIPNTAAESGWGTSLSNFLQAVADNAALKTTHKQNVRQALTSPITISASSDWCVDVRVGSLTSAVTLPTGVEGQTFLICDGYGLFGSYNCTVTPTSGTIQGAGTYVMNHNYQATLFQWSNDRWNIVAEHLGPFISPTKIGDGSVSFTEFLRLANITSAAVGVSDTQTLTNKTISTASNTIGPLDNISGTLSISKGGTGLTAVGSALQVLRTNAGATDLEWGTPGDVTGPAFATDNAIVKFDLTTGKLVKNSGVIVNSSNNVSAASYTVTGGTAAASTLYLSSNVLTMRGGTGGVRIENSSGSSFFTGNSTEIALGGNTVPVYLLTQSKFYHSADYSTTGINNWNCGLTPLWVFASGSTKYLSGLRCNFSDNNSSNYGHIVKIVNLGGTLFINHNDTNSNVPNRVYTKTGGAITVSPNSAVELIYTPNNYWVIVGP